METFGSNLTSEAIAEVASPSWPGAHQLEWLLPGWGVVTPNAVASPVTLEGSQGAGCQFRTEDASVGSLHCRVEDATPHGITDLWLEASLPDGTCVRRFRDEDLDPLRAIVGQVPIPLGDRRVYVDPGSSLANRLALMGGRQEILVVEVDGVPVGMEGLDYYPVRLDGRDLVLAYAHHLRILKGHRGMTTAALYGELYRAGGQAADVVYGWAHQDNERIWSAWPAHWSVRPFRAVLRCEELAGPPVGRAASVDDVRLVCDLINHAHHREALFSEYTPSVLDERFSRAPDAYDWSSLRLTEDAVLGVWEAGERRTTERGGVTESTSRALALDWGLRGMSGEGSFEDLIRSVCGDLARRGVDELSVFACDPGPGSALLRDLAHAIEPYVLCWGSTRINEPDDLSGRGVYVDQTRF
jgi:hypothetical protein